MGTGCYHVTEHTDQNLWSSDVVWYNGTTFPCLTLPDRPTLNDVMEAIGNYICTLSPVAGYGSDDITLDVELPCIKINIGDTLSDTLLEVSTQICNIIASISGFISQNTFDANTILKADVDNTPVALTVAEQRLVGRITGGVIDDLTAAQARSILETVDVDANAVFPYDGSKYFASGAETTADKILFVAKEGATFSSNPHIDWLHNLLGKSYEAMAATGKDTTKQSIASIGLKEDTAVISQSIGAGADTKDQTLYLADQTGVIGTLRYWYLRKDGADSRNLKIGYYNGVAETERLELSASTGMFNFNATTAITGVLDEDTMVSDSAVHVPTQQSVKAYVDNNTASQTELDDTQTGAGLGVDGSYTADAGSTYLTGATSLYDADSILDATIADIADRADEPKERFDKMARVATISFDYTQQPTTGSIGLFGASDIPDNSCVYYVRVDVTEAFTDDGANNSTIGIGIETTGAGTEDIKNAAAIGTDFTKGLKANTWLDFDAATPFKLTGDADVTVNVVLAGGAAKLSTGKLYVHFHYFVTE